MAIGAGMAAPAPAKSESSVSYNMQRANEEISRGNSEEAREYLNKELSQHPRNAEALVWLCKIQYDGHEYREAFPNLNKALKLLPKKEKEQRSDVYFMRGDIYLSTGDTIAAMDDFNAAIDANPSNARVYSSRGEANFSGGKYEDARKDYEALVRVDPTNPYGYIGLGNVAFALEDYKGAARQFGKAIERDTDDARQYAFRGLALMKDGQYVDAADDLMKALKMDYDDAAFHFMFMFPDEQLPLLVAKLQTLAVADPHDATWPYYIGQLMEDKKQYAKAIEAYEKALETDNHPLFLTKISDCYQEQGQYAEALKALGKAQAMDPSNLTNEANKAFLLEYMGDYDGATAVWGKLIEAWPDDNYAYYRRGFVESNNNQLEEALADMEMSLLLNPDYIHALLTKGDLLMLKGETEKAMDCYRRITELDSVAADDSCAMYAFLALGEKEKAVEFMDAVIAADSLSAGHYYDAACLYSRMGDLEGSLRFLRESIAKGYYRFSHILRDDDLEALRSTEAFREFYDEHRGEFEAAEAAARGIGDDDEGEEQAPDDGPIVAGAVEVPFTPDGGCASVKCSINDLPLSFIFDTGASTVSISQVEANFMLKNGYLERDDFVGTGRFVDANGNVTEGTIINLREVEFGGLKLRNVKASVVRNQKAPLLLGQSVLGRLGKIEIDNAGRKLIIR